MPQTPHIERHFTAGETVRDVVIGMSDGLTVPFALAAGLSGAVSSSRVVVVAGLAEIAAGAIAMFGLTAEDSEPIVAALRKRPEAWVDFMMRFELGLEKPDPRRALSSALTIGGAYVAGGFIPLAPYMALASAPMALMASVAVTVVALGLFGWVKARCTETAPLRGAVQTMLIGGAAAAAAFAIARAIT